MTEIARAFEALIGPFREAGTLAAAITEAAAAGANVARVQGYSWDLSLASFWARCRHH